MMTPTGLRELVDALQGSAATAIAGGFGVWIEMAVEGTALVCAAGLAALALRRASAAARHLVWALAAAGLLVLPLASAAPPLWEVELPLPVALVAPAADRAAGSAEGAAVGTSAAAALGAPGGAPSTEAAAAAAPARAPASGTEAMSETMAPSGSESSPAASPSAGATGPAPASAAGSDGEAGGAGAAAIPWRSLLVGAWAAGGLVVLLLIGLERARCRRLARRATPADEATRRTAEALARRLGLTRTPEILRSTSRSMPMTWGVRRPVVLLPADARTWSPARLESVLLHELAHVRRHDYLVQLVAVAACAVHWFNPLAWLAAGRLREERELACDDEALRAGSRPSDYAAELLDLARSLRTEPGTALAAMAMARPSKLSERLASVLEDRRPRSTLSPRLLRRSALLAVAPMALLVAAAPYPDPDTAPVAPHAVRWMDGGADPDVASTPRAPSGGNGPDARAAAEARSDEDGAWARPTTAAAGASVGSGGPAPRAVGCWDDHDVSTNLNRNDGLWTLSVLARDCRIQVTVRGEVDLRDDFDGIRGVGPGGLLQIEEEADGTTRRLEVRPGPGGEAERLWMVDGRPRPFDAEAREWLARMLPPILRRTGLAAEERTRWILAREGPAGVLRELRLIPSDAIHRRYAVALVEAARLDDDELAALLRAAADEVGSDSELAELLVQVVARRPEALEGRAGEAFWAAAATVGSDSEHRTMLLRLLDLRGGERALARGIYASAREAIGSDSEMVAFLLAAAARQPDGARGGGDGEDPDGFWSAAGTVGSDSEMRILLVELERRLPDVATGPTADAFWSTAATVGSDSEHRALLEGLLADEGDGSPVLEPALRSAGAHIGSDSELARFLVGFADRFPAAMRGPLADLYREAAAAVGSDSERRRVLAGLPGSG